MEYNEHANLTAAEISSLWTDYQSYTMIGCGIKIFLEKVDDKDIRLLLEDTLTFAEGQITLLQTFFEKENYPLPHGFTEEDINRSAPRLFSDKLYLELLTQLCELTIMLIPSSLVVAEREDVMTYYEETIKKMKELNRRLKTCSKEKGIHTPMPKLPKPNQIDFVNKQSFMTGWFGTRRPLLGTEISNLVTNIKQNTLGQAVIMAFSQVAQSKELRRYFERGRDIAGKHIRSLSSILQKEYVSAGTTSMVSEVTDSKTAPFSDRLMLHLITLFISYSIGRYGMSITNTPRHDISFQYTRLIVEIMNYSDDGADILIDNAWLEQPPIAANRKDLAK